MAKNKKKKGFVIDKSLPKQIQRQLEAKYSTVEDMQEKAGKRDEALQKKGFLKSHASISAAYGVLNGMKSTYSGAKKNIRKFLHITSIPMK